MTNARRRPWKGLQAFEPEALRSLCERSTVAQLVERGFASQNDPLAVECLLLSVLFVGPDGTASTVETYWRRHETNVGPLALRALLKLSGSAVLRACAVAYARLGACERLDVLSYCASLEKTDADAADAACSAILIGDDAEPDPTPSADCTLLSLCAKRPPVPTGPGLFRIVSVRHGRSDKVSSRLLVAQERSPVSVSHHTYSPRARVA